MRKWLCRIFGHVTPDAQVYWLTFTCVRCEKRCQTKWRKT